MKDIKQVSYILPIEAYLSLRKNINRILILMMVCKLNNRICLLLTVSFLGIQSIRAQNYTEFLVQDSIPMDLSVRYGKLDNGFSYYIHRNNIPKGEIVFNTVIKAGTFHEDHDQLEYAHLIEHLGARGTRNSPRPKEFFRMSGGDMKAYTSFLHTNYFGRLPSKNSTSLKNGLQAMRDWAQGIEFSAQSIDAERGAVLGEMRTSSPSDQWLYDTIMSIVRLNSGFKEYNREKNKANIQDFDQKALLRFYKDWYRPNLQAAIIVGDIDVDSVESKIKLLFSDLKSPSKPRNSKVITDRYKIKLNGKNHYVSITDSLWHNFELNIVSVRPNKLWKLTTINDYKNMLIEELMSEIIQPRINASFLQYNSPFKTFSLNYQYLDRSITKIRIGFNSDNRTEIKEKVLKALTVLKTISSGITEIDLGIAKTNLLKKHSIEDTLRSSILASRYRSHFVNGNAVPSQKYEVKLIDEILNKITLNEVIDHINKCTSFQRNTNFIFINPKANSEIPDYNILKSWLDQVRTTEVLTYSDQEKLTSLKEVAQIPFKDNIAIKHSSENLINVTTINLNNNIKIVLKSDIPGNKNTITLRAYRSKPISIKNKSRYLAATVAGEVINHSGAGSYDKFTLKKFMDVNGIRGFNMKFNKSEQTIYANCKEESLEELLSLLYLYINNPRKDKLAFKDWKLKKKENLQKHRTSNSKGGDIFYGMRFPNIPTLDEATLNKFTIDKIYDIHNRYFYGIDGFTFIITGNYNKEKVASILIKYLSAFPTKKLINWEENDTFRVNLKKMEDTIYINNLDQALIRLYFPVKVCTDIKTKAALSILKRALHSRIRERLRQGCYSPSAYGDLVDIKNGLYEFVINFDSELGNQDKMIQYAIEEFRLLRDEGIDVQEFNKLLALEKSIWSKCINGIFPQFWNEYLKEKVNNLENFQTEVLQYSSVLEHFISVDDINSAAKTYLEEKNIQKFIVLPKKVK